MASHGDQPDSVSVAASVDVAQHEFDARAGDLSEGFNDAAAGHVQVGVVGQQEGSAQVAREQPTPQFNMTGPLADDVNRQVHQDRMRADDQAARIRNERMQQTIDAARQAEQRNAASAADSTGNGNRLGR